MASIKRQWPLGRGLRAVLRVPRCRDQPVVSRPRATTTTRSSSRARPEEGYHFTTDITDKALAFIRDAKAVAPDKPFFMYFCPGRRSRPASRAEGVDRPVRGQVRHGLRGVSGDGVRAPEGDGDLSRGRRAVADQPLLDSTSPEGKPWPELDVVRPWDSLTDDEKRLFSRMAEVYAGFLEPRRPRDRAAARLPRGERPARQHDHRAGLRQRGVGRGRAERLGQREQVLQRPARQRSRRTSSSSTSWAAPRRTTTTRPAGRGRSTPRSRCGSATPTTRAAPPIR